MVAIFWVKQLYYKGRPLAISERAAARIGAARLYQEFAENEDSANKLYLGKVLEVDGIITDKEVDHQHVDIQIGGAGASAGGGINCALRFSKDSVVHLGDRIKVKGRCTGYLMDVNLTDVEIVN